MKMKKFNDLLELLDWISFELKKTDLFNESIEFNGDISNAKKSSAGDLFIEVSQRNENGKTYKITIFLSRYYIKTLLDNLGLKNEKELENKSWRILGKLSFWPSSSNFAITLQSLLPLGDSKLEKRRKEIINKLKLEGLLRTVENKLEYLEPIKKIAVISSETAAGYGDFIKNINKLKNTPIIHLYPSPMQGIEVPIGVSRALKLIIDSNIDYDVIVLIRGGGAQSDLMYFDDYHLAKNIAWVSNNKIPILTGIGHEQDITIPDFVSFMRFSTPTEVARAIVNQIETYNNLINESFQNIIYSINNNLLHAELYTKNVLNSLSSLIEQYFQKENNNLIIYYNSLYKINELLDLKKSILNKEYKFFDFITQYLSNKIMEEKRKITNIESNIKNKYNLLESNSFQILNDYYIKITQNSPFSSFLSGGAVLVQNSKIIDSVYNLDKNHDLEIKLKDGEALSSIKEIKYYRED
jgi:exodeoxyribonuclease VII large subunit